MRKIRTISVSPELEAQMATFKENWSAIATEAFKLRIQELNGTKSFDEIKREAEYLRLKNSRCKPGLAAVEKAVEVCEHFGFTEAAALRAIYLAIRASQTRSVWYIWESWQELGPTWKPTRAEVDEISASGKVKVDEDRKALSAVFDKREKEMMNDFLETAKGIETVLKVVKNNRRRRKR